MNAPSGTRDFASISGSEDRWHISVLIPARNEASLLPRCLASVERARRRLPAHATCDVIVVDDGSTDGTAAIAERMLKGNGIVISIPGGIVGEARSVAAKAALARYDGPPHMHWLANTDADCRVPETWLLDQLAVAEANVQAVAGIVDVDHFDEHGVEVEGRFRSSYLIRSDGTHPHVHGANLGVRADAYVRAGGWSPLSTAEDHDLWNRLRSTGSRWTSSGSLIVVTSGRRTGRAPSGFAQALAAHNDPLFEEV